MEKHLILIDLDGTLIKRNQTISDCNQAVLRELRDLGHEVIIVTGRAHYRSNWFYETLGLDSVFFNRNGGHIHHPLNTNFETIIDRIEWPIIEDFINNDVFHLIQKVYFESKNDIFVYKGDTDYYASENFPLAVVHDLKENDQIDGVNMISLYLDTEQAEQVEGYFNSIDSIYIGKFTLPKGKTVIQVYPEQSNKKKAIKWLGDYYQVPHNRIIALGDGDNDIEMIKAAGIGVAMANAIDEVKQVAKYITKDTNEESGVGKFLAEYFSLDTPTCSDVA